MVLAESSEISVLYLDFQLHGNPSIVFKSEPSLWNPNGSAMGKVRWSVGSIVCGGSMCLPKCLPIHLVHAEELQWKVEGLSCWLYQMKSQTSTYVSRIHPLRTTDPCTKFHADPSNSYDIQVCHSQIASMKKTGSEQIN